MTKEKKKRHRLKIVFTIIAICTIFSMLTISCFAYQSGKTYSPNVYTGTNSYAYHPVDRLAYITKSSGGNYYTKDIPISNVITAFGGSNWVDHGEPLREGYSTAQTIYSDEVYNGIFNPSIRNTADWDFSLLGDDYSMYANGGQIDMNRYMVSTKYGGGNFTTPYQRVFLRLADAYLPNLAQLSDAEMNVVTPQFRTYMPVAYQQCRYSLRCTVSAKSTLTGKTLTHTISLNDVTDDDIDGVVNWKGVQCNIFSRNPYLIIRDECLQADAEFNNTDYWYITSFEWIGGRQEFDLNNMNVDLNGAIAYDLYFPSIRPFDWNKIDTEDKIFNLKSPNAWDVNVTRNTKGAMSLGGEMADDLPISAVGSFFAKVTNGVLDIYILPGISLGGILFTVLAIMFVVCVLRYFAGG